MSNARSIYSNRRWTGSFVVALCLLTAAVVFLGYAALVLFLANSEKLGPSHDAYPIAGQIGDMFGAFSAFVNGIALAFVAYTVFQQNKQLETESGAQVIQALEIFHQRWTNDLMLRARLQVCKDFELIPDQFTPAQQLVLEFFEQMGVFTAKLKLDESVIWDIYSIYIEGYWNIASIHILAMREYDSSAFSRFGGLKDVMAEISRHKGLPVTSTDDFVRLESRDLELQINLLEPMEKASIPNALDSTLPERKLMIVCVILLTLIASLSFLKGKTHRSRAESD